MKRIVFLLALVTLTALLASCARFRNEVAGSGARQKQKRELASFTSITASGAFEIEVVCQKTQSLELEGDDNILPLVSTEVSNNVLHIDNVRGYSVVEPIRIQISVPDPVVTKSVSGPGSVEKKESGGRNFWLRLFRQPISRSRFRNAQKFTLLTSPG